MGNDLKEQGKLEKAIEACNTALVIKPDYAQAYYNMGAALKNVVFTKPSPELQAIIMSILEHKTYVRPSNISQAAISLLKFEPAIKELFQEHGQPYQNLDFGSS